MTLYSDGTIPPETLTRQMFKLVKGTIDFNHFKEYTYTYTVNSFRFSSEIKQISNIFV